jgi:6-phosphogluconolactonase
MAVWPIGSGARANQRSAARRISALAAGIAIASAGAAHAEQYFLYAGSYTSGSSKGIYAWRFESRDGSLSPLGLVAQTPQPAHIWAAPNGQRLYAVNWETEGGVSAFQIDQASGKLVFLNRVSAKGAKPNQVVLDPSGRLAVSVNYDTGNVVAYRVLSDGKLSDAFFVDQHRGVPLSPSQPGPKAHGIVFSPDGQFMYVAELGLDRIYAYRVNAAKGSITPASKPFISVHAGAGPRRLQISPDGRLLYVNHETDSEISVIAVEGVKLKEIQTISTLPADFKGRNSTAEIVLDSTGRRLYVSNRGQDSIAQFDVGRDGRLIAKGFTPAGGRTPRNLRLDPTGQWLVSANENGGSITLFKIDRQTGALTLAGQQPIDTPGGLFFVKAL